MDGTEISVRAAEPRDFEAAARLLLAAGLPRDGFREHFSSALVADHADQILGCVALESYGEVVLLRSLVVAEEARGLGIGERLAAEALRAARRMGALDIYLLTETAAGFFPRFGFVAEDRSLTPQGLLASAELRSACPASALLMHARLAQP